METTSQPSLKGVLTERDLGLAEHEFPGITHFFETCSQRPGTFLELVFAFMATAHNDTTGAADTRH
jgi:hypothetical protein